MTADRTARRWLAIAIAVGLAVRIVTLLVLGTSQPTHEFGILGSNISQGSGYVYFADFPGAGVIPAVDRGHGLVPARGGETERPEHLLGQSQPSAYMPPVYPYVVAGADAVTTTPESVIGVLQVLNLGLFAVLAVTVFWLGSMLLGPRVAAIAALGAALYPPLVYMASQVSASNLYLPAQVAMLALAIHVARAPGDRRMALATGALAGVVALVRPDGLLLVAAIALVLVLSFRRLDRPERRSAFASLGLLVVVAAILPSVWLVRNSATFHTPTLGLTTQTGFLLWAGNHEGATGSGKTFTEGDTPELREETLLLSATRLEPGRTYELRRDELYRTEALSWIRDHPASAAFGIVKKAFLFTVINPDDARTLNAGYVVSWIVLAGLAIAGLNRLRPRGVEWRLLAAYAIVTAIIPVLTVVLPRYRLPIDVVLLVPAAAFVSRLRWFDRVSAQP